MAVWLMHLKEVSKMSAMTEGLVGKFICDPYAEGIRGKAARAAMLTYADYIAPDDNEKATRLREKVIDIENSLGNTTA